MLVPCRWRGLSWIPFGCGSGHGLLPLLGHPSHLRTISFALAHLPSPRLASAAAWRLSLTICVLVSARTELIFFLVAGTVLWFGFSRKIMLITH